MLAVATNNLYGTVLSAVEFRDDLRDQYKMNIFDSPSHCDERNSSFSTTHALSCKVGDLIHSYNDESRDMTPLQPLIIPWDSLIGGIMQGSV